MKRYDNGEVIIKDRMEDEAWYYSEYQPFLHIAAWGKNTTVHDLYDSVLNNESLSSTFSSELQKAKLLRWCAAQIGSKHDISTTELHPTPKYTIPQIKKWLEEYDTVDYAINGLTPENIINAIYK